MKTQLPEEITTIEAAETFLTDLHNNGEAFHPEDDAHEIIWHLETPPTAAECDQLNKLMEDIFKLDGFDPFEILMKLSGHEMEV